MFCASCKTTSSIVEQETRNYKLAKELGSSFESVIWDDIERFPILDDLQYGQLYRYLQKAVNRVGENAGESTPRKVWIIARDDMKHAFMLPNGTSYISTGMVKAIETDLEIAALYAWLIAHNTEPFLLDQLWKTNENKSIEDCASKFQDCDLSLLDQYLYGSFTPFELDKIQYHAIDILCYSPYDIQGLQDLAAAPKVQNTDFMRQFPIAKEGFTEPELCRLSFDGTNYLIAKRVLVQKPYRIMNRKNINVSSRQALMKKEDVMLRAKDK